MSHSRVVAVLGAVALHGVVLTAVGHGLLLDKRAPTPPAPAAEVFHLAALPPPAVPPKPPVQSALPKPPRLAPTAAPQAPAPETLPVAAPVTAPEPVRAPATQAAPATPTAQEWAFAAKYTLKNSKGYRHTWGQQVRSMMGTAVEGPDQGTVRFRIEIAPDGSLAKLETLWTTSTVAEQLARNAIARMPPSPPTPTGKPLVFERTISFSPFASDGPPTYKDDCRPDPPAFRNPFAWDGVSPQVVAVAKPTEKLSPEALAECLRGLPQDSIEAESAQDRRLLKQWGSSQTGR